MPITSALQAVQDSTVAAIASIAGIEVATAVPIVDLFTMSADGDEIEIDRNYLPERYPGATVSVNEDEMTAVDVKVMSGTTSIMYSAPVYVGIFVSTDGAVIGEARRLAWKFGDAVIRTLAVMTPSGMPPGAQAFGPLVPKALQSLPIDSANYAVFVKAWAQFRIVATVT
jgi:hypothetical protein